MATNRVREHGTRLALPVPEGTVSGDPLVLGGLPCVAVVDRDEWTAGEASVQTDGTWRFSVNGVDSGGNAEISVGEVVYLQNDGTIDGDSGGTRFGYALQVVASGATTEIEVKVGY